MRTVDFRYVAGMHSLPEYFVEGGASQMDRKGSLLAFLSPPTGAKHHPKKVRLDPAHAVQAELSTELLMLHRELSDGRAVCLIDNDCLVIKLRQHMPPRGRPTAQLVWI